MVYTTKTAVVITGAAMEHAPLFRQFAQESFPDTTSIDLIRYPDAEAVLAANDSRIIPHLRQHALQDVIRSRIERARNQYIDKCAIIAQVQIDSHSDFLEECAFFLLRERDQVRAWATFRSFALALFTTDHKLIPFKDSGAIR